MKKLFSLLLVMVLLVGCSLQTVPHWEDGDTVGTGAVSFTLAIVDDTEKRIEVTVNTDEETVGDALQALHIVSGEEGAFGLYIETVNGKTLDYNKDGKYWAFYIDGEYAQQSADLTPIDPSAEYMLKADNA